MSVEVVRGVAQLLTLAIFAASVIAAVFQLRHLRGGNELDALLALERDFRSASLQAALADIPAGLLRRLADERYREELARPGFLDSRVHTEMTVLNWFESAAGMVLGKFIDETRFLAAFGRLVEYYWETLLPATELLRRVRGPGQYARFEELAARARRHRSTGRNALPPFERIVIADVWLADDAVSAQPRA